MAQLVNEVRGLGIDSESVSVYAVAQQLPTTDPIQSVMISLHARTRRQPLPPDPYNDEGYVFRILNYRHQVTHRRRHPLLFRAGSSPPVSLFLDPRDPGRVPSKKSIQEEMKYMAELVRRKCEEVLARL
jgi:hypothetical protein